MAAQPVIDITSSPAATQSRIPPSSHRLATVSASDALQDLEQSASSYVQTGISSLDRALRGSATRIAGGFERFKITELWGPSGAGATAIALEACANALTGGHRVMWVDCATPLHESRLPSSLVQAGKSTADVESPRDKLKEFKRVSARTLSHLLALILHPPSALLREGTALLVVDNLNALVDLDYPRAQALRTNRTEAQKWQAGRRYAVLGFTVTALNKLAALNNLAVVVTTGCAMRSRPDSGLGGALAPGIGGAEWDAGIWNRLAIFRDLAGRFVGVQKCGGKSLISREELGEPGRIIGFDIDRDTGCLRERQAGGVKNGMVSVAKLTASPLKSRKRHFDEVADSDGEDEYGWDAGDEEVFGAGNSAREAAPLVHEAAALAHEAAVAGATNDIAS